MTAEIGAFLFGLPCVGKSTAIAGLKQQLRCVSSIGVDEVLTGLLGHQPTRRDFDLMSAQISHAIQGSLAESHGLALVEMGCLIPRDVATHLIRATDLMMPTLSIALVCDSRLLAARATERNQAVTEGRSMALPIDEPEAIASFAINFCPPDDVISIENSRLSPAELSDAILTSIAGTV